MSKFLDFLLNTRNKDERIIFILLRLIESNEKNIQKIHFELANDEILFNTIIVDLNCLKHKKIENIKTIEDIVAEINEDRLKYPSWIKEEIDKIKNDNNSYIEVLNTLIEENVADLDLIKAYVKFDKTIYEFIKREMIELNLYDDSNKEISFIDLRW